MMPNRTENNGEYPSWVGFIFIFNLIVGTGALTLPAVFARAGWLLSLCVVSILAIISYITVTFVIEAMACANAVKIWQDLQILKRQTDINNDDESDGDTAELLSNTQVQNYETQIPSSGCSSSSINNYDDSTSRLERIPLNAQHSSMYYYKLDGKFELGDMAVLFFSDTGRMIFYLCTVIYLYGDLSIYAAAVAKSLRDVLCDTANSTTPANLTNHSSTNDDMHTLCWEGHTLSRFDAYRLFIVGFTVLLGPFAIFSVQKTKYIQILTVIFRWLAFTFMIVLAVKILIAKGAEGHPKAVNVSGLPALFGACVYSFMCHHSLPSLLAPMRQKHGFLLLFSYDYILICAFYILLAMTGIFAFAHLEDLYTLNFIPTHRNEVVFLPYAYLIIDYFLALFPVFTLSATFPIVAITLRNNLQTLFLDMTRFETYNFFVRNLLFPLLAVVPPFIITYFTESLTSLVAFTGSYAGVGIQYLIPIALVYFARRTCEELLGSGVLNKFASPCRSTIWLVFILAWAIACMCLVTLNFATNS